MDDGTALWTPGRSSRLTSLVILTRSARPTKMKRTALILDTVSLASLWQTDGQLTTICMHIGHLSYLMDLVYNRLQEAISPRNVTAKPKRKGESS